MFLKKLKSNIIIMYLVVNLFIIDLGKINTQYNYTGLFVFFPGHMIPMLKLIFPYLFRTARRQSV